MIDFSFIIPAYNEEDWIAKCIHEIRNAAEMNHLHHEIIVVNNNSTDRTVERAREAGARVVHEQIRQIARVRNRGAVSAEGQFFVFVDADTLISPRVVRRTSALLNKKNVVGGGSLVTCDRELPAHHAWGLDLWNTISKRFRLAAGAYLFCRRDAFRNIGGFNENLYASEEIDLSLKLARHGRRRGQPFVIIEEAPVTTSARKLDWHASWILYLNLFMCFLMPWAVYVKSLCRFWYERPENSEKR